MDALKRLLADAEAGDARAQHVAAALDMLAALGTADANTTAYAAMDAAATILGLARVDCPHCDATGELVYGDHRGPEFEESWPCTRCDGHGWGYAEDAEAPNELTAPTNLKYGVQHHVKRTPPTPSYEQQLAELPI